ncbi:MAG: hypothetical protein ABL916_24965 [Burkholderiaceae bacterium]
MSKLFQFAPALARVAIGLVGAAAVTSSGIFVFVQFSDLSALQLAAGPRAESITSAQPAAIVMARTGRAWGEAALQRQAAAASAAATRLARSAGLPFHDKAALA